MSFPRYPAYKDSGVEWLGEVPAHWRIVPLSGLSERIQTGPFGSQLHAEDYVEGGTPVINPSNIQDGALVADRECTVPPNVVNRLDRHRLAKGDIVFARRGEMGRCATVTTAAAGWLCGTGSLGVRIAASNVPEFVTRFWGTSFVRELLELESVGSTMDNLNTRILARVRVPTPPEAEQAEIARFLDRETGKIDALVAEQEKLIALLKEKRQALISHAVTKGLDPNAPMKDSGIAWLGQVPAHWDVVTLRRVVLGFEQGWSPECESRAAQFGEWGVLKAGCVNGGCFDPGENKALPPSLDPRQNLEVRDGDVLMSRASGSPKLIGSVAHLINPLAQRMLSDKIFRLSLIGEMTPAFFATLMGSAPLRAQIEQAIGGADGLANNLAQASIKEFWLLVPPLAEQRAIVEHVGVESENLQALATEADRATTLLKERRAALISSAVTGKICVLDS